MEEYKLGIKRDLAKEIHASTKMVDSLFVKAENSRIAAQDEDFETTVLAYTGEQVRLHNLIAEFGRQSKK